MEVGQDPNLSPSWGCWGEGARRERRSDLAQKSPPCVRKELGFGRWRGGCGELTCFSSMLLVSWEVKDKEEDGWRLGSLGHPWRHPGFRKE